MAINIEYLRTAVGKSMATPKKIVLKKQPEKKHKDMRKYVASPDILEPKKEEKKEVVMDTTIEKKTKKKVTIKKK